MRMLVLTVMLTLVFSVPVGAVEFLGVELCTGAVATAVVLPEGSPLTVESVEVGSRGDLVILLAARRVDALSHVDDLMESYTGRRGTGTKNALQWSGRQITAYGKEVTKKYVALAVSTSDDCSSGSAGHRSEVSGTPVTSTASAQSRSSDDGLVIPAQPAEAALVAAAAAAARADPEPSAPEAVDPLPVPVAAVDEPGTPSPDFELLGRFKHAAAPEGWVDVMGVVANHTDQSFQLATFDLIFYDSAGDLICVDTISVSVLKPGQERVFRDSIQCPDYTPGEVADIKLQFAGGY